LIRDPAEPPEIRARIETTTELVLQRAKNVLEITALGEGKLAKMMSVLVLGDYISVYLAILKKVDPTPVKIIDKIKSELAKKQGSQNL
jgi:glucose/mannose-6-phosphate isomerase